MSRVGKAPVKIASGVKVDLKDGTFKVEGPKGKTLF
jgi:ribosomal protein L6P/L9E